MIRVGVIALATTVAACISALLGCSSGSVDSPVNATGGNAGSSGAPPDSSTAGQGGSKEDAPNPLDAGPVHQPRLPAGLAISEVSVFQAVKVPLARDRAAVTQRNAPVLAGRRAVFRISIRPSESFTARFITAELNLTDAATAPITYASTIKVFGGSNDDLVGSAFDIEVPADQLTTGTRWSARLIDETAPRVEEGAEHAARFPLDGSELELDARSDGAGLQLVLVPFRYDTDGSGRLPDTSDTQLEVYRSLLTSAFPLVHAQLEVHEPLGWNEPLLWDELKQLNAVDFNELNARLYDLKQQDGAPGQAYYYGLINPGESLDAYCSHNCVTGQSYWVQNASEGDIRLGGGMGYSGEVSAWTLIHELGHMHGRLHAPCGVDQWDSDYPYYEGSTGSWGWDSRNRMFMDPKLSHDLMGYCVPTWVSDYTFAGVFERVLEVGNLGFDAPAGLAPHRFLHVSADGLARWGREVSASHVAGGANLRLLAEDGAEIASIPSRVLHDSRGGYSVLVPKPAGHVARVEVSGEVPRGALLAW